MVISCGLCALFVEHLSCAGEIPALRLKFKQKKMFFGPSECHMVKKEADAGDDA